MASILDAARTEAGMTSTELGVRSGISQSQMSKLLRAERVLTVEQLDVVCTVLGLDIVNVVRAADEARR